LGIDIYFWLPLSPALHRSCRRGRTPVRDFVVLAVDDLPKPRTVSRSARTSLDAGELFGDEERLGQELRSFRARMTVSLSSSELVMPRMAMMS
jgi:hypothetical protein